jgi:hypothetical protein
MTNPSAVRFIRLLALVAQCGITQFLYEGWMYSTTSNIAFARPTRRKSSSLLTAPPAVAVLRYLELFRYHDGSFSTAGEMVLGWWFVVCMLLVVKVGPQIAMQPKTLGPYWGPYWVYAFPLSALTSTTITYAKVVAAVQAEWRAALLTIVAVLALLVGFARLSVPTRMVCKEKCRGGGAPIY